MKGYTDGKLFTAFFQYRKPSDPDLRRRKQGLRKDRKAPALRSRADRRRRKGHSHHQATRKGKEDFRRQKQRLQRMDAARPSEAHLRHHCRR